MTLLEKLGEILDKEEQEKITEKTTQTSMTEEVFEALMDKKLSDVETRLNASFDKKLKELVDKAHAVETTDEQTGENV